ncbi:porin family protein [Rapidithrix thailandica]|uniref:Porin family protein n=1 Tax=Rapidithrix thailandica TaxID=413964 RepID=A0AAW9S289_9BACT
MTKLFTSILILLVISLPCLAQKQLEQGVLYTMDGDSINGQIDYKNWDQNPEKFTFQASNGVKTQYDLNTAKGFKVTRSDGFPEIYERAIVEVESSPYRFPLASSAQLEFKLDTVFLRVLSRGKLDLYYLKDKIGKEHFYIHKEGETEGIIELVLKNYYIIDPIDKRRKVAAFTKYRNQLTALTIDSKKSLASSINRLPYKIEPITKLVEKYNHSDDAEVPKTYTFQKQKLKTQIWLNAGFTSTKLNFEGRSSNKIEKADFGQAYSWVAGIGLNVFIPRTKQRISFYPELLIRSYSIEGNYTNTINEAAYDQYNYSFDLLYLKLNALVKLRLKPQGFSPFLVGGFSGAHALKDKNTMVRKSVTYSTTYEYERPAIKDFRTFDQGWVVGIGAESDRFGLELRYESSNGMENYAELDSSVKTLYLVTRVRLGKKD